MTPETETYCPTYAGEPAAYRCRVCGSGAIRSIEDVPRTIALCDIRPDVERPGTLTWDYDPTSHDETCWEGSETVGFECGDCLAASHDLARLVVAAAEYEPRPADTVDLGASPEPLDVLARVRAILWPVDDPDGAWSPDTLDEIAGALTAAGYGQP